jgi:hypothetical protein
MLIGAQCWLTKEDDAMISLLGASNKHGASRSCNIKQSVCMFTNYQVFVKPYFKKATCNSMKRGICQLAGD